MIRSEVEGPRIAVEFMFHFPFYPVGNSLCKVHFLRAVPFRSESAILSHSTFPFLPSGAFYTASSSDLFITVISLLSWRRNRIP